jgi:toxin ParE1/3/4
MSNYKLSNEAKADLIRIHQFGVRTFGTKQADKYFNAFLTAMKE